MALENPYTAQLQSFTSGIDNARRGLKDLYKLRRKNVQTHYRDIGKLYSGMGVAAGKQYDASVKALAGYDQMGLDMTKVSGYQVGEPDVTKAVKDLVHEGTAAYGTYLKGERKAQTGYYSAVGKAEQYEDKTLKTGLIREQPAALSELEQGIVDTQSNIQAQGSAFAQQQAYNAQLQGWMNQMLGYQRQIAAGQSGSGGGFGGSGKESPNTSQWGQYAAQRWGVTVGGWRAKGSVPGSDHPKGLADDIMIGSNMGLGTTIANDFIGNASTRGVKYVIWNHQIWDPQRGWHPYNGPNPHTDHVHVSFLF